MMVDFDLDSIMQYFIQDDLAISRKLPQYFGYYLLPVIDLHLSLIFEKIINSVSHSNDLAVKSNEFKIQIGLIIFFLQEYVSNSIDFAKLELFISLIILKQNCLSGFLGQQAFLINLIFVVILELCFSVLLVDYLDP
jgi:hypothetical protein